MVMKQIRNVRDFLESRFKGRTGTPKKARNETSEKDSVKQYYKARNVGALVELAENELYRGTPEAQIVGVNALNAVQKLASKVKHPEKGAMVTGKIRDSTTGKDRSYTVYLPPGYDKSNQRYPVIYLLHGIMPIFPNSPIGPPRNSDKYWKNGFKAGKLFDGLISTGAMQKSIVVMPSLGFRPISDLPKKENFILNDLVPGVDSTYRTIPDKAHRAIDGYSSGARLGLEIATKNPDKFSSVGGHNGYYFDVPESRNVKGEHFFLTTTYWDPKSSAKSKRAADELTHNGGDVIYNRHKMLTWSQPAMHSYHMWKRGIGMSAIYHSMNFKRAEDKK